MHIRKTIAGAIVALTALAPSANADATVDKALVILTSPDTETQAMALVLSNQIAKQGKPVHLMLCGPAGEIALKQPPAAASKVVTPMGMTVLSLLAGLKTKGGAVSVCAIFLPNRKLDPDALAPDVSVAKPPAIAGEMMDPQTRLATF